MTDKVEGVYQAKGGNIFLNMGGPAVTGKITAHNDKAEIVLRGSDQLTVKEAAAETAGSDKTEAVKAESPSPSPAAP